MIPVILLGGILTGWFTPTEAGVVAVVLDHLRGDHSDAQPPAHRQLPRDFCYAGLIYSLPLITIGAANAFGWMLAYLRGAIVISDWITALAGNDPHLIMLLLVLLFTIVGDFIEPVPTIIIFMPLVNALTEAGEHQSRAHGRGADRHAGVRPDHAALRAGAADGVEIRRRAASRKRCGRRCRSTSCSSAPSCSRSTVPSVVLWLPKQVMPQSVGCFKNPSGDGLYLPVVALICPAAG